MTSDLNHKLNLDIENAPLPMMIHVTAPSDLPAGYTFEALINDDPTKKFICEVVRVEVLFSCVTVMMIDSLTFSCFRSSRKEASPRVKSFYPPYPTPIMDHALQHLLVVGRRSGTVYVRRDRVIHHSAAHSFAQCLPLVKSSPECNWIGWVQLVPHVVWHGHSMSLFCYLFWTVFSTDFLSLHMRIIYH